jgi:hypothetical protein
MAAIMTRPRISQETFDEAVKENIEEFEQTVEEALADAVEQFANQGADLSLVVKTVRGREIAAEMQKASQALQVLAGVRTLAECRERGKTTAGDGTSVDQLEILTNMFRSVAELCKTEGREAQVIASREGILGASALVAQLASVHLASLHEDSQVAKADSTPPGPVSQIAADEAKEAAGIANEVEVEEVEGEASTTVQVEEAVLLAALEVIAAIAMNNGESKSCVCVCMCTYVRAQVLCLVRVVVLKLIGSATT